MLYRKTFWLVINLIFFCFIQFFQAVQFLLDVFTAAIIAWAPTDLVLLLGITPSWFPAHPPNQNGQLAGDSESEAGYGVGTSLVGSGKMELEDLLQFLSYSLPLLLKTQPWSQVTDKVKTKILFSILKNILMLY